MQTPSILNTLSAQPNSTATSKSNNNSAQTEAPFNQVLSREVQNRQDNKVSNKAPSKEPEKNKVEANSSPAPQTTEKKETTAATENKKEDDSDGSASDAADAAAAKPIDLLALVNSINDLPTKKTGVDDADKKIVTAEALTLDAEKKSAKNDAVITEDKTSGAKTGDESGITLADFAAALTGKKDVASSGTKSEALPDMAKQLKSKDGLSNTDVTTRGQKNTADLNASATKQEPTVDLNAVVKGKETAVDSSITQIKEALSLQTQAAPVTAPVQQASLSLAQAVTAQPVERLSPPVGSPAWDQALGQKVVWMVAGGMQSASMTLNPPDLGPLQVVLNVTNDQANATFTSAQPEVRQALEAAMPRLREMMGDAGIQLGSATVSTGTPNQQHGNNEQTRSAQSRADTSNNSLDTPLIPTAAPVARQNIGLVNTFA